MWDKRSRVSDLCFFFSETDSTMTVSENFHRWIPTLLHQCWTHIKHIFFISNIYYFASTNKGARLCDRIRGTGGGVCSGTHVTSRCPYFSCGAPDSVSFARAVDRPVKIPIILIFPRFNRGRFFLLHSGRRELSSVRKLCD